MRAARSVVPTLRAVAVLDRARAGELPYGSSARIDAERTAHEHEAIARHLELGVERAGG